VPPNETVWDLEPHTAAKHELLEEYLKRWIPILGSAHGAIVYVDGFAGPGEYSKMEPGSPVVALSTAAGHKLAPKGEMRFVFIERDRRRADHLKQVLARRFPAGSIPTSWRWWVLEARFEDQLNDLIRDRQAAGRPPAPIFAFVDPFGYTGFPMRLLRQFLDMPRCEVLVTLMTEAMARFLDDPTKHPALTETFGGDRWRRCLTLPASERGNGLLAAYVEELREDAAERFTRTFEMRDKSGRSIYHLVFATNHPLGLKQMKEAMFAVDRRGTFRFSDKTDPRQSFLSDFDATGASRRAQELADQVYARFAGKSAPFEDLELFVYNETSGVYRAAVLRSLEDRGLLVRVTNRRRVRTYPPGCVVQFVPKG
jgi:three-Cys-motif partner protein